MSFWGELRRRNVVKVGVAYLVVAWLVAQVVGLALPTFNAPDWVPQTIFLLLILGFPLIIIVAWAFEITPDGIRLTAHVPKAESITSTTGHRLNYVVTTLLAIAVVFLVFDNYVISPAANDGVSISESGNAAQSTQVSTDSEGALPNSIAVLPFDDLSPNPDDNYFAEGIHGEIINQLSKLGNLAVIERGSVLQFADGSVPLMEIAAALRVTSILRGSFQYSNGRVRILLSLIDPDSGRNLLPLEYEEAFEDIFSVQADIAMSVANALNAEFSEQEAQNLEEVPTTSTEAYGHYLRGQSFAIRFSSVSEIQQAIDAFEAAIDVDPSFGLAYVRLATAYQRLATFAPETEDDSLRRRDAAILRASEIVPDLPSTKLLLAQRLVDSWQWEEAAQTYVEVLEMSSATDYDANAGYGDFLLLVGRASDALPYLQRAQAAEPYLLELATHIAIINDILGNHDLALEQYESAKALPGDRLVPNVWQTYRLLAADKVEEAMAHVRDIDANPAVTDWTEQVALSVNDRDEAVRIVRTVLEDSATQGFNLIGVASYWAAFLGESELAVAALRESVAIDEWWIRWMWVPFAEPIHASREFKELLADIGLPEFWRAHGWPDHCRPLGEQDFECF